MKTFKGINKAGKCIICGKNDSGEVILIPIDGTTKDNIEEAEQAHTKCINLRYRKDMNLIYQTI